MTFEHVMPSYMPCEVTSCGRDENFGVVTPTGEEKGMIHQCRCLSSLDDIPTICAFLYLAWPVKSSVLNFCHYVAQTYGLVDHQRGETRTVHS